MRFLGSSWVPISYFIPGTRYQVCPPPHRYRRFLFFFIFIFSIFFVFCFFFVPICFLSFIECVCRACRIYHDAMGLKYLFCYLLRNKVVSQWGSLVTTKLVSLPGLKNRHGHRLCWMSTGRNNGLMWRTHTERMELDYVMCVHRVPFKAPLGFLCSDVWHHTTHLTHTYIGVVCWRGACRKTFYTLEVTPNYSWC